MRRVVSTIAITAGVAMALMLPTVGLSLDRGARNALRHAGEAMALAKLCPRVEANMTAMSIMLVATGADIGRAEDKSIAVEQARSDIAAWRGKSEDAACVAALLLYGPTGSSVPGLLRLIRR